MYARALTNAGFNVLAVYSGEEALPIAKANNFNLIILDLWMHDKDGMQILRELRGSDGKGLANTKIIITTNYSEDEQSKEAMSAEADGYFVASYAHGEGNVGGAAALAEALGMEAPAAAPQGAVVASLDAVAETSAPATEIAYDTIAPGTLLVQLGAFDDQDKARAEWARLTGSFAELMSGKALVIQPAQSGGKTFYRLRAHGFASDDDTRRFCTAMLAENATCIPVAQR